MICPNNFAKEVARASGRKMPDVSDELIKNGFDSVKKGEETKKINKHKFSSDKIENDNLNSLHNSSDEMLQMAADAGEYEKVFKKEARGIHNVTFNDKKATYIKTDLKNVDSAIRYANTNRDKGAKHIKIRHLTDKTKLGYITNEELVNLGNSLREYIKINKEPFIDNNGARIYEWENREGVRFRVVVDSSRRDATTAELPQPTATDDIITFYSDRNLNEPMNFKNPKLNQPIKEFGTNYAEFYHDGKNAIKKLLTERQGQVAGAFEREELGDIDLVWGEFKVVKGEIKGYGLSKIEAKHLDDFAIFEGSTPQEKMANGIAEIIEKGEIKPRSGQDGVNIEYNGFIIGINKGFNGAGDNKWVVTAFDNSISKSEKKAKTARTDNFTSEVNNLSQNSKPNSTTTANKSQEVNLSRAVVGDIQSKAPTTAVGSKNGLALRERIITFDSDRNLNEPIKEFGTNYAEFYHDGKNAIKKLLTERQGQVAGAFEREELGDIDLVWGEFKVVKGEIKGYGLSKIEAKHLDDFAIFEGSTPQEKMANGINEIIQKGVLESKNGVDTIIYKKDSGEFRVGLSKGWNNQGDNRWIITAYNNKKVSSESIETSYHDTFTAKEPLANQRPNSTTTANKSQEVNIQPIKEFGTNYAEFYHDGKNAIKKLLTERQGQVAGAFERQELGDIDLVWGEVTDAIKHKGYGLSHILDKRMAEFMEQGLSKEQAKVKAIELINKLPDIIKNGEVRDLGNGKVRIVTENYSVGMKKEWKGEEKNPYILTAFENTKESAKNLHSNTFTKGETLPLNSSENSTTTANKSQEVNIQPIKEFGTNYAEFYHDGKNAIKKLLTERQGQVVGAFEREELGDIDLVWGEVTDAIKHKGYGLSHILDKRMAEFMEQGLSQQQAEAKAIELINKLPDIIKNGQIEQNGGRFRIQKDNYVIGLTSEYKGEKRNWIITAFERGNPQSFTEADFIAKSDNLLTNPKPNSTTTANKSQENILKGVDGKEYPNTIAGRWEKRVDEAFDWAYKNIYAKGVKSGIKGAEFAGRAFGSQETGAKIQRGLEKTFALQDEIGALSRLKSAYLRNSAVARMEAMKIYESLVKLEIDERVALFRMLDGQEVEPNLAGKLRPTYQKLRDKIDERAELLIKLGMLKGQNAKENYIKYSYSQYYGKKDGALGGFGIGKLRARDENLSYEDRVKLGLIEDAAIAVTQTLNSQNNQIQKAILLKSLADEYAVDQPKDGYVKVSDESVGGGVKKYGALAGKYVPSVIYDDLQNAGVVSSIFDAIRPYTDIIDHIKVNLTVKNPATHGYNVLSNSVLAFLHGDTKANLDLIKLLATNKKEFDELLAKAEAMGLDTASDDIELKNLYLANDKVAKEASKKQNPLGYYIAKAWQNIYLTQNSTTGKVARKAYEWEDKWFKLARFKKNLDIGMSDEAAFSDANSAYVDYSSHFNPTLRLLDKSGVLPFFHFAVKSSIVVTKAAIKNPAKFAMLQAALISSGASSLPYWFDSEQKDADNSRLPDWAASNYLPNLFGVKNQVQVGESGLYFNAARAMAGFRLSSIDDITGGGGLVGGLLYILRGRDSWGNEMVGKHDPAIKQLTARLDAFSKQFLPSITLGRYARQGLGIATGNNPKNAYNEPMGLGELAGRFIGLRMINEKKELRSAAINAKNRYKKAKDKGDEGAMVVALNDFMACKAAAVDMGVSLEALIKMRSKDIK